MHKRQLMYATFNTKAEPFQVWQNVWNTINDNLNHLLKIFHHSGEEEEVTFAAKKVVFMFPKFSAKNSVVMVAYSAERTGNTLPNKLKDFWLFLIGLSQAPLPFCTFNAFLGYLGVCIFDTNPILLPNKIQVEKQNWANFNACWTLCRILWQTILGPKAK